MPFAASHSRLSDLDDALDAICADVMAQLDDRPPDLSLVFVSHDHAARFDDLAEQVRDRTGTRTLLGCAAETVIGGAEEIEEGPAVSLWSAGVPNAEFVPFHVQFSQTADGVFCSGLPEGMAENRETTRAVLLLGEPFSAVSPIINSLLPLLAEELPGVPVVGGMASGGGPGANRLFLQDSAVESGAVGVVIRGGVGVRTVVSQGCRPIGSPFVVTHAERNIVFQLGGEPPMKRLQEFFPQLSPRDQQLAQKGLHLGLAMNEYQERFEPGDFLISNVLGADRDSGAIALGNLVRVGQTVQFHVRDAETADEELTRLLEQHRERQAAGPHAALLFSCNGRGTRLFPEPHHDAAAIQQELGPVPLAGFFAQGELGPVAGKNYIHGYTASIVLFE